MTFVPQKAIKGQALADFLAAHPVSESSKLHEYIPDEVIEVNITSSDDVCSCSLMAHQELNQKARLSLEWGSIYLTRESCPHSCILVNRTLF